jgi:hypothetical protein
MSQLLKNFTAKALARNPDSFEIPSQPHRLNESAHFIIIPKALENFRAMSFAIKIFHSLNWHHRQFGAAFKPCFTRFFFAIP